MRIRLFHFSFLWYNLFRGNMVKKKYYRILEKVHHKGEKQWG